MGYRLHPDVAWRTVDDAVFLLTTDSRYHRIGDEVGVRVWHAIAAAPDGSPPNLGQLVKHVVAEFAIDSVPPGAGHAAVEAVAVDLADFLGELVQVGAIERVP